MVSNVPLKYGKKNIVKQFKEKIISEISSHSFNKCIFQIDHNRIENSRKKNYFFAFLREKKQFDFSDLPKKPKIKNTKNEKQRIVLKNISSDKKTKENFEIDKINVSFQEKVMISFKGSKIVSLKIEGQLILKYNGEIIDQYYLKFSDYFQINEKIKIRLNDQILKKEEDLIFK